MKTRLLLLFACVALVTGAILAHGNKVHVRGTIEKINPDSVQVKTPDGKSVEVKLTGSTVYLLHVVEKSVKPDVGSDQPAKAGDLAVGDLVVIHATPKGGALEADEVKFSLPPKPKS
jgi:hypothetical protein